MVSQKDEEIIRGAITAHRVTMVMKIITIMARLSPVGGGFVQLTASDDTARTQRRELATSHDHPPPPGTTTRGHHDLMFDNNTKVIAYNHSHSTRRDGRRTVEL